MKVFLSYGQLAIAYTDLSGAYALSPNATREDLLEAERLLKEALPLCRKNYKDTPCDDSAKSLANVYSGLGVCAKKDYEITKNPRRLKEAREFHNEVKKLNGGN